MDGLHDGARSQWHPAKAIRRFSRNKLITTVSLKGLTTQSHSCKYPPSWANVGVLHRHAGPGCSVCSGSCSMYSVGISTEAQHYRINKSLPGFIAPKIYQVTMERWATVGSMLGQRSRRWPTMDFTAGPPSPARREQSLSESGVDPREWQRISRPKNHTGRRRGSQTQAGLISLNVNRWVSSLLRTHLISGKLNYHTQCSQMTAIRLLLQHHQPWDDGQWWILLLQIL